MSNHLDELAAQLALYEAHRDALRRQVADVARELEETEAQIAFFRDAILRRLG